MKRPAIKILFILMSSLLLVLMVLLYFNFEPPQVTGVSSYRIISADKDKMVIDCQVDVHNNNAFSITCKRLDVLVSHLNTRWIQATLFTPTVLQAEATTSVPMRCTLITNGLPLTIEELIKKDEMSVMNEINGRFTFLNLPYAFQTPIVFHPRSFINDHKELLIKNMDCSIKQLEIKKISLDETLIGSNVCIKNIFPFPVKLKECNCWFSYDSESQDTLSVWRQEKEQLLQPQQTDCISTEWQVKNLNVGKWGLSQLTKGYLDTYLHGYVALSFLEKEFRLPLEQCIRIYPLSQKIEMVKK